MLLDILSPEKTLQQSEIELLASRLPKKVRSDAREIYRDGVCCITAINCKGIKRELIFSSATANIAGLCAFNSDVVSVQAAKLWLEPKKYSRSILATHNILLYPTIATGEDYTRPTWLSAINTLNSNLWRVAILTTDPKKRVWCHAKPSIGDSFSIYLHDPSSCFSANVLCSLHKLRQIIAELTTYYNMGFTKAEIKTSLLANFKNIRKVGVNEVVLIEQRLTLLRKTSEFLPALIIIQKTDE